LKLKASYDINSYEARYSIWVEFRVVKIRVFSGIEIFEGFVL